jgi:hypothetical protein
MMVLMPKGTAQEVTDANNMTKRHIAIDDTKLDAVKALLRTTTITRTIDVALDEVIALAERRYWIIKNRDLDWAPSLMTTPRGCAGIRPGSTTTSSACLGIRRSSATKSSYDGGH